MHLREEKKIFKTCTKHFCENRKLPVELLPLKYRVKALLSLLLFPDKLVLISSATMHLKIGVNLIVL